jgi:hypothetical protein
MPVRVVVLDGFPEVFDLGDASREIASLLVLLLKVAPGAGVSVVGATRKPSGIGTGKRTVSRTHHDPPGCGAAITEGRSAFFLNLLGRRCER